MRGLMILTGVVGGLTLSSLISWNGRESLDRTYNVVRQLIAQNKELRYQLENQPEIEIPDIPPAMPDIPSFNQGSNDFHIRMRQYYWWDSTEGATIMGITDGNRLRITNNGVTNPERALIVIAEFRNSFGLPVTALDSDRGQWHYDRNVIMEMYWPFDFPNIGSW